MNASFYAAFGNYLTMVENCDILENNSPVSAPNDYLDGGVV